MDAYCTMSENAFDTTHIAHKYMETALSNSDFMLCNLYISIRSQWYSITQSYKFTVWESMDREEEREEFHCRCMCRNSECYLLNAHRNVYTV